MTSVPISTPPPDAPDHPTPHHVEPGRGGDGILVGSAAPLPEVLLPSGGSDHRSAPEDVVWGDVVFRLQVEAIRAQLAPLRSRLALASSYGREAGHRRVDGRPTRPADPVTPLQVAYALRWLELADPEPRAAAWPELLDGPLD
jgi:hypothetical protein